MHWLSWPENHKRRQIFRKTFMDLDLAAVSEINEKKLDTLEGLPIIFC